jgi:hypothetical protein
MKNPIVADNNGVFTQAEDITDGIRLYAAEVGMMHFNEALMQNAIITAEAAVRGYGEARAAKKAATAALRAVNQAAGEFLRGARYVLALRFDEVFSEDWVPTGFPNQSTAVPRAYGDRQALLRALQNYFANHATYENAPMGITAVAAGVLFNAMSDKRSALNESTVQVAMSKAVRDAAMRDLRSKIRGCIAELEQLLPDNDPRWYGFGLNPPAAPETPETPEGVELVNAGPGRVAASWEGAPRADRYRVLKQIVGVDAEPVPVETVYDTEFTFTNLPAGKTLRVLVEAVNDAGTSIPSEAIEIVVG